MSTTLLAKFADPLTTAKGEARASVAMTSLETLWFNTGTLCNIECANCYIDSSPTNDRLIYLTQADVRPWLDEAAALQTREIGFTGGESFLNPEMITLAQMALERGFETLVLTNAMRPMMRPRVQQGLLDLKNRFGDKLVMRVSLDHYTSHLHETERGPNSFAPAMEGLRWLSSHGFKLAIAGRTCWGEDEANARKGYGRLFAAEKITVNADDPSALVLFPEMKTETEPPEITTDCWDILGKSPDEMMCATSRMIVRRKGAGHSVALACTLLVDDPQFEMGRSLEQASKPVHLNHKYCATFCVLGGGSCSA
ncbi:MAG: radical SAM protein [Parvularculaceae bacterium]